MNRQTGHVWVKRLVCAHDCGLVVNPESLRHTVECAMLHSLSRALHEEVQFDTEKVTSVDWISHPTLTHADVPEQIDVVLVNGDPNPNRPDLPPLRSRRGVAQTDDGGDRQRHLRCDRRSPPPSSLPRRPRARRAESRGRVTPSLGLCRLQILRSQPG